MSEYQYVAFRAIDAPVSEKNLEYMERQSSRAEITPWSFDNEYHFGDFRGDALEMLRRGYGMHVHYANFGVHKLMIRLPQGWPDAKAAAPYLDDEGVQWKKDKSGPGGALVVAPCYEPGELEGLWNLADIVDRLLPLQGEILAGDLRPLYLAHLAVALDGNHDPEETTEAPVPAGLSELTSAQLALAEYYNLHKSLLDAAAQGSPALPAREDAAAQQRRWLKSFSTAQKDEFLARWLSDEHAHARGELLAEFCAATGGARWPTVQLDRTMAELRTIAAGLQQKAQKKTIAKAAKEKAKRMANIAADPSPTLRETEKLVQQRSTDAYRQIAAKLGEVRDALAGTKQAELAAEQARKLKKAHPTLKFLVAELRREGFLPK